MKKVIISLLIFFIVCCSNKKESFNSVNSIRLDKLSKRIKLSNYVESISLIPLEHTDKLIGKIDKFIVTKENFIILDTYTSKAIFIFSKLGKIKKVISKIGKGPGEYVMPINCFFDEKKQKLYVLDLTLRKVIEYNINGEFISEFKIPFGSFSFTKTLNGNFLFSAGTFTDQNKGFEFLTTDSLGNSLNKSFKLAVAFTNLNIGNNKEIYFQKDSIFVVPKFANTIFRFINGSLEPILKLDFGRYKIPVNFFKEDESKNKKISKLMNSEFVYSLSNFSATENYFIFTIFSEKHNHLFFINRKTNDYTSGYIIIDDIKYLGFPQTFVAYENLIYGAFDNWQILDLKKVMPKSIFPDKLKNVNYLSNPVIAIYKLKDEK